MFEIQRQILQYLLTNYHTLYQPKKALLVIVLSLLQRIEMNITEGWRSSKTRLLNLPEEWLWNNDNVKSTNGGRNKRQEKNLKQS